MLTLFNTLTLKKDVFKPLKKGFVSLYSCGPTVYDYPHIGNMRAYIFSDTIRRTLEHFGFSVQQVINITDVGHLVADSETSHEDKIELSAKEKKMSAQDLARFYTDIFLRYLKELNIKTPADLPRASDYIAEQIAIIELLEKKGFTYKNDEGVYFDTQQWEQYGLFGRAHKVDAPEVSRITNTELKKNPADFALWRLSKPTEQRQQEWTSPWGVGYPGWHTECLAMSKKILGIPFDIHTGGVDHIFVHHQNEIAQSECAWGKNLARYWMHSEFLSINAEKMSKSLKNFTTLDDITKAGFDPLALRLLYLQGHYRSKINFTFDSLTAAHTTLANFNLLIKRLNFIIQSNIKKEVSGLELKTKIATTKKAIKHAITDDLNTPQVLAHLFSFISDIQPDIVKGKISLIEAKKIKKFLDEVDELLGIINPQHTEYTIPSDVRHLIAERKRVRAEKNYTRSDEIRIELSALGWTIEDTAYGEFAYLDKNRKA